jgi:LPXTG-motif cell wall-anchored protein
MGKMYAKDASVVNLTSKKGDTVTLYAIWKPDNSAATTASIFSDGTALIYVGAGILLASIAAAVIYAKKKKKEEGKEQTADEA